MNRTDVEKPTASEYYTFRIRKREVQIVAAILTFWFFWSQASELEKLFRNLLESIV